MGHPFFPIIIPCWNVEPYVRECLESVLRQPFGDWEIWVGVEESEDRTEEIVREIAATDRRIHMFIGPRSGSASCSRNIGMERARWGYVIFLDGDDLLAEDCLRRLHQKIMGHPCADLYPCAMHFMGDTCRKDVEENYPIGGMGELTGVEATIMLGEYRVSPNPQVPLTIFRREFLRRHHLKFIPGIRNEEVDFSPKALYLAQRCVPIHEPYYWYRVRPHSAMSSERAGEILPGAYHRFFAMALHSLGEFFRKISQEPDFDSRCGKVWARHWTLILFIRWFSKKYVTQIPRAERLATLNMLFGDGFSDYDALMRYANFTRRFAFRWVKVFVRCPMLRWLAERFFVWCYFPWTNAKSKWWQR